MRWSKGMIPTFKEVPAEAEIASHRLMIRSGLISKLAAGIYTLLPLGMRVGRRVADIVREEIDRAGGQEIFMPVLSPRELWEESGRWQVYGQELMRLSDRHGRDYALGPTHEEIVTDIVRRYLRSYRQLPLTLYQIQTKFRDEIRPRFGVMRSREFMMKDAYSFHRDEESLEETYRRMHLAYRRIFARCGLRFGAVEADSGAIGGDVSHEFMVFAGSGESEVFHCDCGYAATSEQAASSLPPTGREDDEEKPLEKVKTPGQTTVEEVSSFLGVEASRLVKTIVCKTGDDELVAAMIRGDREMCEAKLVRELGGVAVMATAAEIERATGGPLGFSGPVGLKLPILLADRTVDGLRNIVTGANEVDSHFINVNSPRDFQPTRVADLLLVRAGDPCPRCGRPLETYRGIEVGQIFKLGTRYSTALGATFIDESGTDRPLVMGCYGIGIMRTAAAAVEQHHDDDGISWPISLAPFQVEVLPVNMSHDESRRVAEKLYGELTADGLDILLDDREERAGAKFKDADLVGIPFRVTVGERALAQGEVELRRRDSGEMERVPVDDIAARVRAALDEERNKIASLVPEE